MTDLLREHLWTLGIALVGLFLLSRYIIQRAQGRKRSATAAEPPLVGPEGYRRARKQFLLTLALLLVIVAVAVLTHLQ
jgi:hypothetical protein